MKVVLTGGGTAGHTSPLLAVADKLRELDSTAEFVYIGQKGDQSGELLRGKDHIRYRLIHAGKFRRYHTLGLWQQITNFKVNLLNVRDIFLVIVGFFEALFVLMKERPDVMFCKGGYVVVPVGWAGRLLRIPYITHDSDSLPGLANRLISKGAMFNAVAHKDVKVYPKEKTVVTGVPVAEEYYEYSTKKRSDVRGKLGISDDDKVLFVYAGTQGARAIDDALDNIASDLFSAVPSLRIFHVFGKLNDHLMTERYQNIDKAYLGRVTKLGFIPNAYEYMNASDVILGRAGATTLAEIATIGRASVIVPAEQLTGGHQVENSLPLAESGAIKLVRQTESFENDLKVALIELFSDGKARKMLEEAISTYSGSPATDRIAQLIEQVYTIRYKGEPLV